MIKIETDISLEDRLLRYCAQASIDDKINKRLKEILRNNLDWPYILRESIKNGISCLLYRNLLDFKTKVPENTLSKLKEIYYIYSYRNTKIYQQLKIILSSFNKEGLNVILLKGGFLAEKVYNNIALRAMADIDLLIKKEDLIKVDRLLVNLGYNSPIHKELLSRAIKKSYMNSIDYFAAGKNSPPLHIHWHIVNVTLPAYMYSKNIKMNKFFEYAKPIKMQDVEILQLAPHHLIMHLAEHALKHSFYKLIYLSDINEAIKRYSEEIDWEELIKETKKFGMQRQVYYGLYFTKYFLGADMPDCVLSSLRPEKLGILEKQFFYGILNNNNSGKLCYFVYLNMVKGIINKLRFIYRTFFPPPVVLALTFNLNKHRVTIKDYLSFLGKQFRHLKSSL